MFFTAFSHHVSNVVWKLDQYPTGRGSYVPLDSPAMSINRGRLPNWTAAHRGFLIPAALPIVRLFPSVYLSASLRWGVSLWMKITMFYPRLHVSQRLGSKSSLTINYPVMKKFTLVCFGLVTGFEPMLLSMPVTSNTSLSQQRLASHKPLITEY